MNVDGYNSKRRLKKRWMECINNDMVRKGLTAEIISNRDVQKKNIKTL